MADTKSDMMLAEDASQKSMDGALHVFGDVVLDNEADDPLSTSGSFFMYTPSPVKPSDISATSLQKVATTPTATPSATTDSSNEKRSVTDKTPASGGNEIGGSRLSNSRVVDGQENDNEPNVVSNRKKSSSSAIRFKDRSSKSKSSLAPDTIHKTQLALAKAEQDLQAFRQPTRAPLRTKHSTTRHKNTTTNRVTWENDVKEAKQFQSMMEQKRQEGLRLQRQLSSQASRQKANFNAKVKISKLDQLEAESQFKSSVYRDHQKVLRDKEEKRRRESVAAREKLRLNAVEGKERMRMEKIEEDQANFDDRHAMSQAFRETKRNIKDQRRKSYQFRNGDAQRIRNLHRKLQEENKAQRHESYELDRLACKDVDDYRKKLNKERRESMANRNMHASAARQLETNYMFEVQSKEHESAELERAASKDVDDAQRQYMKDRRLSEQRHNAKNLQNRKQNYAAQKQEIQKKHDGADLERAASKDVRDAQRQYQADRRMSEQRHNEKAQQHKKQNQADHQQEMQKQHESYDLKRAGEKDVDSYKLEVSRERRESYVQRGKDALEQRKCQTEEESKRAEAEHASYELKREASKDVEKYKRSEDDLRRESLQNRNKERSRHAKVMNELQQIAQEQETESFVLKWAAENDVKDYLKHVQEKRKESLEARGQEAVRIRQQEIEEEGQRLQKAHDDELIKAGDQKDVESYHKKCAERDRASLQYRRKDAMKQRLEEAESFSQDKKQKDSNWELENLAFRDVEDYVKTCKDRRRQSLAFRAKEKRRHAKWKEEQKEQARQLRHEVIEGRSVDHRYMEMAKQEERLARTLEAIQHQNRVYAANAERL